MRKAFVRLKGLGFIFWHARHAFYHVLLGLVWAWFLREQWAEFNPKWIWTAVIGSLIPDIDHFFYFFGYGKQDDYTQQIAKMLRGREWRAVTVFIEAGHKQNTSLSSHNLWIMGLFLLSSLFASLIEWQAGVILFGAILIHYLFDMADDIVTLGHINSNWKRWGKPKLRR